MYFNVKPCNLFSLFQHRCW